MPQKQVHPITDNTNIEEEQKYQQGKLKCNKDPLTLNLRKTEISSETEEENPEDPHKVESP